jgi:integrin-linked kinase-associated serine/threonine phosphatase 2C
MEDTHIVIDDASELYPDFPSGRFSLYSVFDGHGGKQTAILAEQLLPDLIFKNPSMKEPNPDLETVVREGYRNTELEISKRGQAEGWRNGSTAVSVLLDQQIMWIANAGDSEALIGRKRDKGSYAPVVLTQTHRPNRADEKQRIKDAGAVVKGGRINGTLGVSRGFGDPDFKQPLNGAEADWVSSEPYIARFELTPADDFLLLACDGLFDFLNYQDIVDVVAKTMKTTRDPYAIADALVRESLDKGSLDNITAIVVLLS